MVEEKGSQNMHVSRLTATRRRVASIAAMLGVVLGLFSQTDVWPVEAQAEQRVEISVKDFTFVTRQVPLQLGVPTVIMIRNEDAVRHDFGSVVFDGSPTQVESNGVISYGQGIRGVYLDPQRSAMIRLTIERPGRYEFRCSIHPNMKGEILLMSVGAV
jgi:plastocyanin